MFLVATELLALVLTVAFLLRETAPAATLGRFAILLALSVGYAEISQRVERARRYLGADAKGPRPNPLSVWSFAAVLVLPVGWAVLFVLAQQAQSIIQRQRERTSRLYRQLFVAAAAALGQVAAGLVIEANPVPAASLRGGISIAAALATFTVVNLVVVLIGMALTLRPSSLRAVLPDGDAVGYELALLTLGIGTAQVLLHTPWLVPLTLLPVAYLHRSALVKTLDRAARTDSKTGLLNATAWSDLTRGALARCARAGRGACIAVIDLDHFKDINDRCGHLAGDRVLAAVAGCLKRELRGHDGVGRFGGDEFVLALEEVDPVDARMIAGRVLSALAAISTAEIPVGASMGLAHTADHGYGLDALLEAADVALYAAKSGGRGRLVSASPAPSTGH